MGEGVLVVFQVLISDSGEVASEGGKLVRTGNWKAGEREAVKGQLPYYSTSCRRFHATSGTI